VLHKNAARNTKQKGKNMSDFKEQFGSLMGKIIRVETRKHKLPLFGRLIAVSDEFLTLERRDGSPTILHKGAIIVAELTLRQPDGADNGSV
jgi:hypothetical protein